MRLLIANSVNGIVVDGGIPALIRSYQRVRSIVDMDSLFTEYIIFLTPDCGIFAVSLASSSISVSRTNPVCLNLVWQQHS